MQDPERSGCKGGHPAYVVHQPTSSGLIFGSEGGKLRQNFGPKQKKQANNSLVANAQDKNRAGAKEEFNEAE